MKNKLFKSIIAIVAGFAVGAALSIGTDVLLAKTGLMITDPFQQNPWWVILIVIIYRFIYNVTGCYTAAKLAPDKPMKHAMIIGVTGTLLSIAGAAVMWDPALAWYNISIMLISLPSAWVGGKLFTSINKKS